MSAVNGRVDVSYANYYQDFRSIIRGIQEYRKVLATSSGDIELVYFSNLEWNGHSLSIREKPCLNREFGRFSEYKKFLVETLEALGENMRSPHRSQTFHPLGTLSSGYDSPTVSVLAKQAGLREILTFETSRGGTSERGEEIARILGLEPLRVRRSAWREHSFAEVPLLAANAYGEEVHYRGAESVLLGRVLLTGFHGGRVWKQDPGDTSTNLVRGDPTGTSLTEYRLWAGFLHCPVPFFGAREIAQIARITNSQEMAPWDLHRDYNRPICRRIVEEAGVPRHLFGVEKHAASVTLSKPSERFLTEVSAADFLEWLRRNEDVWTQKGQKSPLDCVKERHGDFILKGLCGAMDTLELVPLPQGLASSIRRIQWSVQAKNPRNRVALLFYHLFPWAIERAKNRYQEGAS